MDKTLVKNVNQVIKKFMKRGVVGASKACLKQNVKTKDLTLSVDEFNRQFDEIVNNLKVNGFNVLG